MGSLVGKSLAGFLALLVALGAFVFLPAWTINYFQAWVYLAVFAVCVFAITIYLFKYDPKLLERRVKAGPTAEKEKSQKGIQVLANLFFCAVFIIAGFDYGYHWSEVAFYISLISDLLVGVGFYIVFLVFKENSFTSAIIEVAEEQKVISTGPYGVVRHPMYSGAMLMMLFSPLALGSCWALFAAIALVLTIVARLLAEEKYLAKNLSGYMDYCRKVPYRLVPGIW